MSDQKVPLDLQGLGTSGLPVYSGKVYDEALPELHGERGRKIFREMSEQDPIIGGILLGIEMLSRQVEWTIKPADDTDEAKSVAEFFDECLSDMVPSWDATLSEILSMLVYGWSWMEIVYKKRKGLNLNDRLHSSRFNDGKIGWATWGIRSQETMYEWEWSEKDKGHVTGMVQWAPPDWSRVVIPRSKSLHFTTRSRRENPEGVSMLRTAYRSWYMKKNLETIEAIGVERDLAGLPVLFAQADLFSLAASDNEKALLEVLKTIVTSIKRDEQEGILMPLAYDENGKELYKLELLSTGGDRQFDTTAIIGRYNEGMAMSMLADFILMGHDSVGSFALSTNKTGLFGMALGAILDLLTTEINQEAFPRLARLNGKDLSLTPSLQHGQIDTADLGKLGEFLKALSAAGMAVFPNPKLEEFVLNQAGLPHDPGAGEYPLVQQQVDEEGNPIGDPIVVPPPPQGLPRNNGLNPAGDGGGQQPAPKLKATRPGPGTPSSGIKPASKTPTRVAGAEPRTQRHFVPLAARVSRIKDRLKDQLEPQAYEDLLRAVMDAGKFSSLSQQHQEIILSVESE